MGEITTIGGIKPLATIKELKGKFSDVLTSFTIAKKITEPIREA